MFRSAIVASLVLFNVSLQAEVGKDFLISLRSKFGSKLGLPVFASDFNRVLNLEEQRFLDASQDYDYTDIFHGTLPLTGEVYSYNLFHPRGLSKLYHERRLHAHSDCKMVYTEDGLTFRTSELKVFRNPPADKEVKGWRFSFCAGSDDLSDQDSVVYYFHGAAGNPYNFVQRDATYELRQRWREIGPMPRWVSVSLGSIGHLGEKEREHRFFNIIVPYIEKEMGFKGRPKQRFGLGISQGGANVVHAVMKGSGFFDAAVAICPAVIAVEPYADKSEFHAYRMRTSASRFLMRFAMHFLPHEFRDPDYWMKYVDPLRLGQVLLNESSPPLYIQTSSDDEIGLQEGGQIFAMLARTMGAPVMFEELKGGHCVLRPHKIAEFFQTFQQGDGEIPLQLKMHGRTRR